MEANQSDIVKEVGEDDLMLSLQQSRKQPICCKKLPMTAGNKKHFRLLNSEAGRASEKMRKSEKLTRERNLAIVGLEKKHEAQDSGEEEEGVDNKSKLVCLKPEGRN